MPAGTAASPTDGFKFQWRSGNFWMDIADSEITGDKTYTYSKTSAYSVTFDCPETEVGTKSYLFRIIRSDLTFSDNNVTNAGRTSTSISINTNTVSMKSVSATGTTEGINVKWNINPGRYKAGWKFHITNSANTPPKDIEISLATSYEYTDINIAPCTSVTYTVAVVDANGIEQGTAITSAPVVRLLPDASSGTIDKLSVSKGYYNDRIILTWNVSASNAFTSYVVKRQRFDTPTEQTLSEITNSSATQFSYEDPNAIPGVFYTYKVEAVVTWSGTYSVITDTTSTGFIQPYGVVSGKVSYGTGSAVQGVSIAATGDNQFANRAITFDNNGSYLPIPCSITNTYIFPYPTRRKPPQEQPKPYCM
jgi:hypothetical protein